MNPSVFIVGCARSGTTLLKRMVNAHPRIAITPETHWIPRFFDKRRGLTADGLVTYELLAELLEYPRFAKLRIDRRDLEGLFDLSPRKLSYSDFVTAVFDLYGKAQGKSLVGDKTPEYVRTIRTLHTLWPAAKFVHLIRDGRDVCLSVLNWRHSPAIAKRFATWDAHPVITAALWWEWNVRLGREAGNSLTSDLYHEIRYESLVADPAAECSKLCAFLGLPSDDAMLRFNEGRERSAPGLSAKQAWLPPTPGLRDWRSQMPAGGIEQFEATAGGLLHELGYPRAYPSPSAEVFEHVGEICNSFVQEARAQGRPLPAGWRR